MRKLITLTLLLTSLVLTGRAQGTASYFTLCDDALSGTSGMTVKAILDLSNDNINWGLSRGRYQVAAFIEGECHAFALEGEGENMTYWDDRDLYGNWFELNIRYTSARRSKPITFKLYNRDTGLEYNLKNDDNIRSIGINMGSDTKPIVLKAVEARDMSFTDFEMKVNNMQDLSSKLVFTPAGATCPNNLEFEIYPSTYTLDVTGNGGYQFTPSATGSYDISHYQHGLAFRNGTITVTRATNYVSGLSINPGYETITVTKGDADMLGDMLAKALKVTYYYNYEPDEYPEWVSSNESIVGPDASGRLTPKKNGTCTLTAQVKHPTTGAVRLSASLTVKVGSFVTYISVLHDNLNCAIGDDVTDCLPRMIDVQPSDADDRSVSYTILRGDGILEKRADGHIVAVGEGMAMIEVTANDGGGASPATLYVYVQNIKKSISVKQKTLTIKYEGKGKAQDITAAINGNVAFLPEDALFAGGEPTFTSGNTDVVTIEQTFSATGGAELKASALKAGTAEITVQMEVPDLIGQSLAEIGTYVAPKVVTETFTVVLTQDLSSISFGGRYYDMNVGETIDFTNELSGYPSGVAFDKSKVTLSVDEAYKSCVRIDGLKVTALLPTAPNEFTLTAAVSGASPSEITAETDLCIFSPATAINVNSGYETIEVYVGEGTKLTEAMKKAFSLVPANSTDGYYYEIADNTIVSYDDVKETFTPLKGGTTKITAIVQGNSSLRAELTVKVLVKAGSIYFEGRYYDMSVGETLDFTNELRIYPADAEFDKSKVTLSVDEAYQNHVRIDGLKVTALLPTAPNEFGLTATVNGSDMTAYTDLCIYSPATAMWVNSGYETIEVYVGESARLTELLGRAITIEPENTTDTYYWEFADESIVIHDYDQQLFVPLKGGTTKATAYVNGNHSLKAELTIKVLMRAGSISFSARDYAMNVGETKDFAEELSVYPADAEFDWSKVVLSVPNDYKNHVKIDGLKVTALLPTAPKEFTLTATVSGASPSEITAETELRIYSPATAINVNSGYETIEVYVGESTKLTEAMNKAFTIEPSNSTDGYYYEIADNTIVSYDDVKETFTPLKGGTTKITAIVQGNNSLRATLTVRVLEKVEDLDIAIDAPDVWRVGVAATLTVKAKNGSALMPSGVSVTDEHESLWPMIHVDDVKSNDNGSVAVTMTPQAPGSDRINVGYGKQKAQKDITIGVPTTLTQGWQWMTLYSDSEKDPAKVFGSNIHEVRSQTDLLAYEEGEYYGTLTLEANKAYMVRAANDVAADKAFVQTNGLLITKDTPFSLYDGWTWMAYPYHHAYSPADLQLQPAEGDRIVSKDEGFAEYGTDGWTGDLLMLKPYQSYLYYNNRNAAVVLGWKPETTIYNTAASRRIVGNASQRSVVGEASKLCVVGNASQRSVVGEASKLCNYDPSISRRFRDNMTIIAQLIRVQSVSVPWLTLAAFVGNECRGVSHTVNGLLFITVHANAGEMVSFRLYDEDTGQCSDVEEKVVATQMLGTLRYPLQITVNESQGIVELENKDISHTRVLEYDLRGVLQSLEASPTMQSLEASPTKSRKKGSLVIRRQADGRYKKVVVR